MENKHVTFAFFGTGALAESVLAALVRNGYIPKVIVTKPDSLQGRHMKLVSPHIKTWAELKGIPVIQPTKLDQDFLEKISSYTCDMYIVASYGKIIPESVLMLPKHGVLNVHPSLLPLYRGPSPIESVLLDGNLTTGVTIMKLDKEMDHGPILAQIAYTLSPEITAGTLEVESGQRGGELLVQVIPHYLDGTLIPKEQDHHKATVCKKITKDMGEVTLGIDVEELRRKFRALTPWPSVYFFYIHNEKKIRVKITSVDLIQHYTQDKIAQDSILTVIPEGKKEMDFQSFLRGYSNT